MKRNKKQNIRLLALILILLLGIGFAALAANLKIDGTVNVAKTSWDVHFENVSITEGSVTANPAPTSDDATTTEMSYTINFTKPGDFFEFTVDMVNDGTIDAMVEDVSNKVYSSNGTTEITLPGYLTSTVTYYESGAIIEPNHLIAKNTSEKIVVRIEFRQDINASDLPSSGDTTVVFKFKGDYKQADSNAVKPPCPSSSCVYAYPVYTSSYVYQNTGSTEEEQNEYATSYNNNMLLESLPHTWWYNTGTHVIEYESCTHSCTAKTTATHEPTTLQSTNYKTDYNELIQETGKNYFIAMQLDSNNKISKGYVCYKDSSSNKTTCWKPNTALAETIPVYQMMVAYIPNTDVILIGMTGSSASIAIVENGYSPTEPFQLTYKNTCVIGEDIGMHCVHQNF